MFHPSFSSAFGETRLVHLFKEVGSNAKTWGNDTLQTYIKDPVEDGNYPKALYGIGLTAFSTATELIDYGISGIVDKRLEAPGSGPFARTRRDVGELLGDAVRLRPLKTVANILRLPGSLISDGLEVGQYDHTGGNVRSMASRVRNQSASVLNN